MMGEREAPRSAGAIRVARRLVLIVVGLALCSWVYVFGTLSFMGGYGSFGLRPMTHGCLGIRLDPAVVVARFPHADLHLGNPFLSLRYWVEAKHVDRGPYCLGQDIWYGE